jgi:hypothetical protein
MTRQEKASFASYHARRMMDDGATLNEAVNHAGNMYGLSDNQRYVLRCQLRGDRLPSRRHRRRTVAERINASVLGEGVPR